MTTTEVCRLFALGKCHYGETCKFLHVNSDCTSESFSSMDSDSDDVYPVSSPSGTQLRNEHIKRFFENYCEFIFNEDKGALNEWRRLCREVLKVDPENSDEYLVRKGRRDLNTALVRQFNTRFGKGKNSIESWKALCHVLDIPAPDTLEACREIVMCTHVNLVDLTESYDGPPQKFATELDLSEYCRDTKKFFPLEHVEAGSLLNSLLRHIMNPRDEKEVRGQARARLRRHRATNRVHVSKRAM